MKAVIIATFNNYELRTRFVEQELQSKGYDVTIISSDFEHLTKSYRNDVRENTVFLHTKQYRKNLSFARIKSHIDFAKNVYKELCKREPDMIYCLLPVNSLAKYVRKYKNKHSAAKVIFDIFDLWPESLPISSVIKRLLVPWKNLRDKNLKCADRIITECEYYKQFLPKGFNYDTVYLCKEKREIEYKHDDVLRFLYLGSINNIIDIDGIVNLLSETQKHRTIHLHIVGGGEAEKEFTNKLTIANIPFTNHGRIFDEAQKDEIASRCHFGLNMYKSGLCIGLTMKSLDYFCRGLPIANCNIYDTGKIIEQFRCGSELGAFIKELPYNSIEKWEELHENCLIAYGELFSQNVILTALRRCLVS